MGPPASGKGTQAQSLLEGGNYERVETGTLLRRLKAEDSPLGRRVGKLIDAGIIAPPPLAAELVIREARSILRRGKGVIFDGSPRSLFEAELLLSALRDDGVTHIAVVVLDVPKPETAQRIELRWICSSCGKQVGLRPEDARVCPQCGGTLIRRVDDTPEVLERRWEQFLFKTAPVIGFFERKGLVIRIDGNRPIPEITADVHQQLRARFGDDVLPSRA